LLKAARAGRVKKEADGTWDVEACRAALAENSNLGKQRSARKQRRSPSHPTPGPETASPFAFSGAPADDPASPQPDEGNYSEACRRLEWLKVEKAELELARKRGELAPLVEVNAHIAGMITRARDVLLRIDCDARTKREIERALRELSEFEGDK
jgi:hypothetical protein